MIKKKNTSSLKMNFFYNILYRISGIIIPIITTPYVSRVLGPENTGVYSYTFTIAWYFVILGCFGFENYGNRQIAMVKDDTNVLNKTFTSLFALQAITSIIAIIGYGIYLIFFCQTYKLMSWLSSFYVLSAFFNISWLFYGLEQFKKTTLRSIVARFSGLILILIFVKTREDLWKYVLILAAMELLNQLVLWINVNRYVRFVKISFRDVLSHLKGCTTLFVPIILINIYRMMDKLMLGHMTTMSEVGFYTYADKITEMPFHVITALGTVMLPHMTNLVANGEMEKSKKYIESTMRYNTIFSCAIAFGMIAVSADFSVLFFGEGYMRCAELIIIMAPMLIVRAWANVARTQFLMPNHRDKEYIISLAIGMTLNLVLNAMLIPKFGATGAALATLIAESSVAITQILFTAKDLPVKQYLLPNIPFIAFGGLMWLLLRCVNGDLHGNWRGLIAQIAIGSVLYVVLSLFYLMKLNDPIVYKFVKVRREKKRLYVMRENRD